MLSSTARSQHSVEMRPLRTAGSFGHGITARRPAAHRIGPSYSGASSPTGAASYPPGLARAPRPATAVNPIASLSAVARLSSLACRRIQLVHMRDVADPTNPAPSRLCATSFTSPASAKRTGTQAHAIHAEEYHDVVVDVEQYHGLCPGA
jgi:hypothetical protein